MQLLRPISENQLYIVQRMQVLENSFSNAHNAKFSESDTASL